MGPWGPGSTGSDMGLEWVGETNPRSLGYRGHDSGSRLMIVECRFFSPAIGAVNSRPESPQYI
jgi:hypothetical protein